jgi:hypothetical protein
VWRELVKREHGPTGIGDILFRTLVGVWIPKVHAVVEEMRGRVHFAFGPFHSSVVAYCVPVSNPFLISVDKVFRATDAATVEGPEQNSGACYVSVVSAVGTAGFVEIGVWVG